MNARDGNSFVRRRRRTEGRDPSTAVLLLLARSKILAQDDRDNDDLGKDLRDD